MIERVLRVMSFLFFIPFCGVCIVLFIPIYIIRGVSTMIWIDMYCDFMTDTSCEYEPFVPPHARPIGRNDSDYPETPVDTQRL